MLSCIGCLEGEFDGQCAVGRLGLSAGGAYQV